MRYCVIDTETTLKNKGEESVGDFKANPHHPDNKIVYFASKIEGPEDVIISSKFPRMHTSKPREIDILVGHNIGFDILYLLKGGMFINLIGSLLDWLKKGQIWDTMIVEYLLTGQEEKMASLDKCAIKYGGTLKDEKIQQYWEDGVETEDIPDEELKEYLKTDVENTHLIFLSQLDRATELNMLPLIWTQMDARLATIMMELDGMYFDKEEAARQVESIEDSVGTLSGDIAKLLIEAYPEQYFTILDGKISFSQKVLHPYLFGGTIDWYEEKQEGEYKSGIKKGKPKYVKERKYFSMPALFDPTKISGLRKGKTGMYSLDEDSLKRILNTFHPSTIYSTIKLNCRELLQKLLLLRELEKESQMLISLTELAWPIAGDSLAIGGIIHPSYNHAITETGRLSCSKPNLQQITR
jgi:DNA polymerase I-like protein with 3'-5' exonuclease and polymerase domains